MELIDRQAAKDALANLVPYAICDVATESYTNGLTDAYNLICQLPSAQQWIPCSERLPKKADGEYWVCTDTGYQCQCRWTDDVYGLGSSGEWAWKIFDIPQYSHVIAWMPLPKPWKGEENERAD